MTQNNIKEASLNRYYILLLLLPPLVSSVISFYMLVKTKRLRALLFFGFFYTITLTYIYPTYDTMLRYWRIHKMDFISFLDGDPLSNWAYLFNDYIDVYYFFFIYWLIIIVLFYKSLSFNSKYIPTFIIFLCIVGLTWQYVMNLTYFTFATIFSLYYMEKYKSKYTLYIPILFIAYLLHPGILLVFLPSILLYYLLKMERYKIAILYLVLYSIFLNILFGSTIDINTNNLFILSITDSFNNYTSVDTIWGKNIRDLGLKGNVFDIIQASLFIIILFYVIKNIHKIKDYVATSFFLIALVTLINILDFYTFSERTRIVATFSALIITSLLYRENLLSERIRLILKGLIIMQFIMSNLLFVQPRQDLFINEYTSYDISVRAAYIPSCLLVMDIHDFAFSDAYLLKNSINRN